MEQRFRTSDRVVKTNGEERGREGEVCYIYNDEQMEIRYCSTGRSYDVKMKNYVLASEWVKSQTRPYKPKQSTIEWIIEIIARDAFELDEKKYVAPKWWLNSRLASLLVDKGFLERIGPLSSLFRDITTWEKWQNAGIKKKTIRRPIHYNCLVYQVLKDINQFNG